MTPLEEKLRSRLLRDGPITFRDFMQAALYDEEFGYYNTARPKIGPTGDFYTSSNVHAGFGATLAVCFAGLFIELDKDEKGRESNSSPIIVEMGAGTGQLAADLLAALREEYPAISESLRYIIVETSPAMRARQQENLADFGERIEWRLLEDFETPLAGIFFSNELIDAFPVHRMQMTPAGLRELYVAAGEGPAPFIGQWREPSNTALVEYAERLGVELSIGQILEINLEALAWLRRVSKAMARGFLVTIDYGDIAAHLYGQDRRAGTLRCFYRHRLSDAPLERAGEQDITASVNFSALIDEGTAGGFETVSLERQAAFLMRYGLLERIVEAGNLQDRLAMKNLFVPGGASDRYRVLIQRRR